MERSLFSAAAAASWDPPSLSNVYHRARKAQHTGAPSSYQRGLPPSLLLLFFSLAAPYTVEGGGGGEKERTRERRSPLPDSPHGASAAG